MKKRTGLFAIGIMAAASIAMAHSGAKGVVLERMNGMTAMRDIMRDLAPVMQGAVSYDAVMVSEAGYVIASHAGDTMRALFPDGSLEGVTYANPNIWTEWKEFAALSDELRDYAEALSLTAPNGLEPASAIMRGIDRSELTNSPDPEAGQKQKIASLMGYAAPKARVLSPASTSAEKPKVLQPAITDIGATKVFEKISGTCSACHARFRKGRS